MDETEELDLKEIFDVFWSKKWILIALAIIGALVGVIYTNHFIVPKYSSSATLILSKPVSVNEQATISNTAITENDIMLNQKLVSTYGEIIKSRKVVSRVISNLNLNMRYDELIDCISTSQVKDTDVVKVSVTTKNANQSVSIVNEIVKVFSDEIVKIYSIKNISIIDEGQVNNTPVNVNLTKTVVIFALIFAVVGCAVIFMIYFFDNTIRSKEEIERILGLPVLAEIPEIDLEKEEALHEKKK